MIIPDHITPPVRSGPMTAVELVASVLLAAVYDAMDRGDESEALLDGRLRGDLLDVAMGPRRFGTPKVLAGAELEQALATLRGES